MDVCGQLKLKPKYILKFQRKVFKICFYTKPNKTFNDQDFFIFIALKCSLNSSFYFAFTFVTCEISESLECDRELDFFPSTADAHK